MKRQKEWSLGGALVGGALGRGFWLRGRGARDAPRPPDEARRARRRLLTASAPSDSAVGRMRTSDAAKALG